MIKTGYQGWLELNLEPHSTTNLTEPLSVKFNLDKPVANMSFMDAADYTANLIASRYNNIHVALSGGLDSEFVAKTLLKNNILFTPVIVLTDTNGPEVWYAHKFCAENNLTPKVYDFQGTRTQDLVRRMLAIASHLQVQPTLGLLPIVLQDLLDNAACILTGYGEPFYNSNTYSEPMGTELEIADHDFVFDLINSSHRHPGAFLAHTPEIFNALISDIDYSRTTQMAKAELYQVLPRPKTHFNIFNLVDDPASVLLRKKLSKSPDLKYQCISKDKLLEQLQRPFGTQPA